MATINVRVDDELKAQATALFSDIGMDMSTAINVFLRQSVIRNTLPFQIVRDIPNEETIEAMREVQEMKKHPEQNKRYGSMAEIWAEIDSESDDE